MTDSPLPQDTPRGKPANAPGAGNPNRPKQGDGGGGGGGGKRRPPPPKVVEVAPIATKARMRKRHWAILFSFLVVVLVPVLGAAFYLWTRAADQYASTVGFTVRQEEGGGASDLLGGIAAQVGGGGGSPDAHILYEFIQSQALVARIDEKFDLRALYSAPWEQDPFYALHPDATLEDLVEYWQQIVRISYDESSRLIELRVLSFDADAARDIAAEIVAEGQQLINELSAQARADTMRYAESDLDEALERLRQARAALIAFRSRTQIVDPETDLAGRMGVVNTLQAQLAAELIELDVISLTATENDPRVRQSRRKIEVIRARIAEERRNVAGGPEIDGAQDYPALLAEYEALVVDREFAEESYRAALAALDVARADASRQSRYLSTYIPPTMPETAEFPRRWLLVGLVALFAVLSWTIMALVYYSVRDSR